MHYHYNYFVIVIYFVHMAGKAKTPTNLKIIFHTEMTKSFNISEGLIELLYIYKMRIFIHMVWSLFCRTPITYLYADFYGSVQLQSEDGLCHISLMIAFCWKVDVKRKTFSVLVPVGNFYQLINDGSSIWIASWFDLKWPTGNIKKIIKLT